MEATFFVETGGKILGLPAPRSASPLPADGSPIARPVCCIKFKPPSNTSCEASLDPLKPQRPCMFEHGIGGNLPG